MERITEFKSKYAVCDEVEFYNYTGKQCGTVNRGGKVSKKPEKGMILAVIFDCNNLPLYTIQCDGKGRYSKLIISHLNVSENHILKII